MVMVVKCRFCSYCDGSHDHWCPQNAPNDQAIRQAWERGYEDGRARRPEASTDHPYALGWLKGNVAAEEAMESVPWSGN